MSPSFRTTIACACAAILLAACATDPITAPGVAVDPTDAASKQGPTGGRMLFNAAGEALYSMEDDGTGVITVLAEDAYSGASWSADGKQIVFAHKTSSVGLNFAIYLMNADGTGLNQLTHPPVYYSDLYPRTVGKLVVFERMNQLSLGLDSDIWIVDPSTGMETQLTSGESARSPTGSPSGKQVAFSRGSDIYVYDLATTATTRLTSTPALIENNPAWSPGGKLIAYDATDQSNADLSSDLYVMDADGGNVTRLTDTPLEREYGPVWSPDGKRLAFTRFPAEFTGTSDIWILDLATRASMNITPGTSLTSERVRAWAR